MPQHHSAEHASVWTLDDPALKGGGLPGHAKCDVCVVGAGIAGLTTAYLLAKAGRSVVVLDSRSKVAGGETLVTTAHLANVLDDRFSRLESVRGAEACKLMADSHRAAIELIGRVASEERIDCDYRRVDGYLFLGRGDDPKSLDDEADAARRAGLTVEKVDRLPVPGTAIGPALRFADQGQFHPEKYLAGVAKAVRKYGGVICGGATAESLGTGPQPAVGVKGGPAVVADAVVVATNTPFHAGAVTHSKLAAYTTYAFACEVPQGSVPHALYWDTEDPYHYVRLQPGEGGSDYLIVGGEDHKTGQADDQSDRWARLVGWTRERFPQAGPAKFVWSGQVFETPDGLGLIGRDSGNVFVITGDSGMGMTHGTLGGRLVADLILGVPNPWEGLYDPSRKMLGAAGTYLAENANLAAQYRQWFTGGDVSGVDQIPPGHGAVIRRGLSKVACYRDKDGTVCERSAVCPHMKAIVTWNPGEGTWDCPAHGSRFGPTGKVVHGPATDDLGKVS